MPRKKKNGSNGLNMEKCDVDHPESNREQKYGTPHFEEGNKDRVFQELQQMFSGKLDGDVVHMILDECEWKVDVAIESLLKMVPTLDDEENTDRNLESAQSAFSLPSGKQSRLPLHVPTLQDIGRGFPQTKSGMAASSPPIMSDGEPMTPLLFPGDQGQGKPASDMMVNLNFFGGSGGVSSNEKNDISSPNDGSVKAAMNALDTYINHGPYSDPENMFSHDLFKYDEKRSNSSDSKSVPTADSDHNYASHAPQLVPENIFGYARDRTDNSFLEYDIGTHENKQSNTWSPSGELDNKNMFSSILDPSSVWSKPVKNQNKNGSSVDADTNFLSLPSIAQQNDALSSKRDPDQRNSVNINRSPSLRRSPRTRYERTISLEPLEAANLEQLVKDVVISGVSEEHDFKVIDDSDEDVEQDENSNTLAYTSLRNEKSADVISDLGNLEKSQSNLKVAVKHMRNLPPRFLRKLKTEGSTEEWENNNRSPVSTVSYDTAETPEKSGDMRSAPKGTPYNHKYGKKEWKKVNMGDSQDHAVEISSFAMNMEKLTGVPKSPAILCSDLEEAMINSSPSTPGSASHSTPGTTKYPFPRPPDIHRVAGLNDDKNQDESQHQQDGGSNKVNFSVNAPEFIPRFVQSPVPMQAAGMQGERLIHTPPISLAPGQAAYPTPLIDRMSPQLNLAAGHSPIMSPGRNSPIFMSPRQKGVPVGFVPMPFYPAYPYAHMPYPIQMNPFLGASMKDRSKIAAAIASLHHKHPMYNQHKSGARYMGKDKNLQHLQIHDGDRPKSAPTVLPVNSKTEPSHYSQSASHQKQRQEIVDMVKKGSKVIVILRGCPGSGKSTLAKELKMEGVVLSADDFFVNGDKYEWDVTKLSDAHVWNQKRAAQSMSEGRNPVIVDNTNIKMWEMRPYVKQAIKHKYRVEFLEPNTAWRFNPKELHKRNSHNVPLDKIKKMVESYERNPTVAKVTGDPTAISARPEASERVPSQPSSEDNQPQPVKKRVRVRKKRTRRRKKAQDAHSTPEKIDDENSPNDPKKDETEQQQQETLKEAIDSSDFEKESPQRKEAEENESVFRTMTKTAAEESASGVLNQDNPTAKDNIDDNHEAGESRTKLSSPQVQDSSDVDSSTGNTVSRETSTDRAHSSISSDPGAGVANQMPSLMVKNDENGNDSKILPVDGTEEIHIERPVFTSADHTTEESTEIVRHQIEKNLKHMLLGPTNKPVKEHELNESILEGLANQEVETITSNMPHNSDKPSIQMPGATQSQQSLPLVANPFEYQDEMDNLDQRSVSESDEEEYEVSSNSDHDDNINRQVKDFMQRDEEEYKQFVQTHRYSRLNSVNSNTKIDAEDVASTTEKSDEDEPVTSVDGTKEEVAHAASIVDRVRKSVEMEEAAKDLQSINFNVADSDDKISTKSQEKMSPTTAVKTPTSTSKSSTRKRLAAKFTNQSEKFLGDGILNTSIEWQTPPFSTDLESEGLFQDSVSNDDTGVSYEDANMQTSIEDFNFLYKVNRNQSFVNDGTFAIKPTKAKVLSVDIPNEDSNQIISASLRLDKGCMTEDLVKETSVDEGFEFVHDCFPSVAVDDLKHILTQCKGDLEWTINILLDSGYERSDHSSSQVNDSSKTDGDTQTAFLLKEENKIDSVENINMETTNQSQGAAFSDSSTDSHDPRTTVDPLKVSLVGYDLSTDSTNTSPSDSSSVESVRSPPQLAFLCCSKDSVADMLGETEIQQRVFAGNLRRMFSVEEFQKSHPIKDLNLVPPEDRPLLMLRDQTKQKLFREEGKDKEMTSVSGQDRLSAVMATEAYSGHSDSDVIVEDTCSDEADEADNLYLTLDNGLAQSLLQMFGPADSFTNTGHLQPSDLRVCLSRSLAAQLYQQWMSTLQHSIKTHESAMRKMIKDGDIDDEEFARKLQSEIDHESKTSLCEAALEKKRRKNVSSKQDSPKLRPHPLVGIGGGGTIIMEDVIKVERRVEQPPSLQSIMDEEMAQQRTKKDLIAIQDADGTSEEMSTKLKNRKLHDLFPTIDKNVLDEVFQATGYNLESAIYAVQDMCDTEAKKTGQNLITDEDLIKQASMDNIRRTFQKPEKEEEGAMFQTFNDPDYQDLRAEATTHHKLRQECFTKAQDAYRQGMKQVASFYSQQGHLHTEKLREANKRAAEKTLEYRNANLEDSTWVDLHGLHANEALQMLKQIISDREAELRIKPNKKRSYLSIITGRGNRSRGGVAKIKPMVMDFVKRNNYSFTEPQAGVVRIVLK